MSKGYAPWQGESTAGTSSAPCSCAWVQARCMQCCELLPCGRSGIWRRPRRRARGRAGVRFAVTRTLVQWWSRATPTQAATIHRHAPSGRPVSRFPMTRHCPGRRQRGADSSLPAAGFRIVRKYILAGIVWPARLMAPCSGCDTPGGCPPLHLPWPNMQDRRARDAIVPQVAPTGALHLISTYQQVPEPT